MCNFSFTNIEKSKIKIIQELICKQIFTISKGLHFAVQVNLIFEEI